MNKMHYIKIVFLVIALKFNYSALANNTIDLYNMDNSEYTLFNVKHFYLQKYGNPISADSAAKQNSIILLHLDPYKYVFNEIVRVQLLGYGNKVKKALAILDRISNNPTLLENNRLLGYYFNVKGGIFFSLKKFNLSRQYYKKGLKLLEKSKDFVGVKGSLINIGNTFAAVQVLDSAFEYYRSAENLQKQGVLEFQNALTTNMAALYMDLNLLDEATLLFENQLNVFKKEKDYYGVYILTGNLGKLYMIQNKYELAISTFIYSINLGSKHALSGVLAIDDYYNLSLCYKKKGDFENALSSLMTSNSLYKKEEKKELNEYIIDLKFIHELELLENEKNLEIHKKEVERHEKYSIIVFTFSLFVMGIVLIILYKLKQKKNKILAIKNLELTVLLKNTSKKRTIKDSRDKNFSHELIINLEKLFKVDKVYTDKKLTLEKLAKLLKTNRSYLSENVNVYYGKPFRSVLNTFRITEAKLALIDDRFKNYSIEGVALTVGYGNMSSFNSAFKKETGITPSYFRKEYLNSKNINNEFILCNTTKTFSG